MALAFRDSEALQVAVRAGVCPADVAARGARVGTAADGAIVVAPDAPVADGVLAELRALGVSVDAALPAGARAVSCWAEAIAPVRVPRPAIPSLVLLVTPRADELIALAAELVRLGCDRVELTVAAGRGVARVVDPPTYTVVRALDREGGLRVFAPDPPGQERVWTELGYRHPLVRSPDSAVRSPDVVAASLLRVPDDALLLLPGDASGWWTIPAAGWRGLDAALELAVPATSIAHAASTLPARRRVELRLAGGRREAPSFWVLRSGGVAAIDALLAYLPDEVVARLAFAVTADEPPTILLRARTGRAAPPELAFAASAAVEAYAPLAHMPDVYAPATAIVEPPLRRERLREILGVTGGDVLWLARVVPGAAGAFRVERIADAAFAPLADWADYVLHAHARELVPWMRATELDFAAYVSTGLEWGAPSVADEPPELPRALSRTARAPAAPAASAASPAPARAPAAAAAPRDARTAGAEQAAVRPPQLAVDDELVALENEFVALATPADAPERLALLARLGAAYARLGRRRDAGLCFARAAWEAPAADAPARLDEWLAADLRNAGAGADAALAGALAATPPTGDDVRLVAALAARAAPGIARDAHRVQRWLDEHDGELDARSLWLARASLAQLAGGDALALAHARDRILARLAGGLSVERELPAFLRFAGRSGALGAASGEHLRDALDALATRLARTKRKLGQVEAPVELTNAYVGLVLAHGHARIGNPDRARAGIAKSRAALESAAPAGEPVHAYLLAAFAGRIEQVIAGDPPDAPLAAPISDQLARLDRMQRYVVDRLRESSWILEPVSRPSALTAFVRQHDARGAEFAGLRDLPGAAARAAALDALVTTALAPAAGDANRERLLDGVFGALLELPGAAAAPILARAWPHVTGVPAPRRALLYASALVAAGHHGRTDLVPEILRELGGALHAMATELARIRVPQQEPDTAIAELDRVVQRSVRTLRRIGLRAELAELLTAAEAALAPAGERGLRARVVLASGMAFLGDSARALPILEEARAALATEKVVQRRCELTRALALAYAHTPLASALAGIAELSTQFASITDHMTTNSHYCWSVLHFVESLVLGITSDDLALGEAGRRFVEDDEHLIRRRLHRDLRTAPKGST